MLLILDTEKILIKNGKFISPSDHPIGIQVGKFLIFLKNLEISLKVWYDKNG